VGRHDLAQSVPTVPDAARERLVDELGSGAGLHATPRAVVQATESAFVDALGKGLTVSAMAVAVAAVLAWLPVAPGRPAAPEAVPAVDALDGELAAAPQPARAG
jgi:hypothetical protein